MSKVLEAMRERLVFNQYEFYKSQPYIWYQARGDSRSMTVQGWMVTKRGEKLATHWKDNDSKHFYLELPAYDPSKYTQRQRTEIAKDGALKAARAWASERFGVKEWAKDPFGSYGPAEFVAARLKEILSWPVPNARIETGRETEIVYGSCILCWGAKGKWGQGFFSGQYKTVETAKAGLRLHFNSTHDVAPVFFVRGTRK